MNTGVNLTSRIRRALFAGGVMLSLMLVWMFGATATLGGSGHRVQSDAIGVNRAPDLSAVQVQIGLVQRAMEESDDAGADPFLPTDLSGPDRYISASTDRIAVCLVCAPARDHLPNFPRAPPAA